MAILTTAGDVIRELRRGRNLTIEMTTGTTISPERWSEIENGSPPAPEEYPVIARGLGMTVGILQFWIAYALDG